MDRSSPELRRSARIAARNSAQTSAQIQTESSNLKFVLSSVFHDVFASNVGTSLPENPEGNKSTSLNSGSKT